MPIDAASAAAAVVKYGTPVSSAARRIEKLSWMLCGVPTVLITHAISPARIASTQWGEPSRTLLMVSHSKPSARRCSAVPVVAVSVWYNVGSKDEPAGRTGFAHLFEHMMFYGSENAPGNFFPRLEEIGATDWNGTTWFDRTNYFETVPTTALDMTLWLESDRMGHLLGAIGQEQLDEQRGVVQNEKRQGDNEPYGLAYERILRASFPEGHPYRWDTIGSMDDLNAASLDDVKQWFREYYGAANTTIVLAGRTLPKNPQATP